MNSFIENLNQWGGQLGQFAWPMLWQSSLLIAFVFALDFLLGRKIRASVRYAFWLAVLVKLLLPPTLALPTGAAWWLFHAPPPVKTPVIQNYTVTYDTTPLADYVPPSIALPPPAPPKLNGAGWGLLAAGAVSAALLLWLMIRWWQVARMVRGAAISEDLAGLLESVRQQAGWRSRIRLKLVEGRMSPAVCGLFRPVILLPRTLAENLSPTQLRAVLLHEVFHLRRLDVWVNCAQALLQIVYWWHPLLWFANARIRRLREEAVDDAVMLALRDEADSYAPTLLEVAKLAFRRPLLSLGLVGIMESRSALRQRIERLMDFRAPRRAGLTFASLCGICVFSAVALPMGEAPSPAEKQSASNATTTEPQPQFALMFAMTHPESEGVLKKQLLEAGVKIPPTIVHDFNNGQLFARGTKAQLVLVQQMIWRLNGYSPQEVAAATNIPDYAVKIPVDQPATTQLYSRTFKISTDLIYANLLKQTGTQSNTNNSTVVSPAFRKLFVELGLNLESPPGKSIFYNEKLGKLFTKATASDLDMIECAVEGLMAAAPAHIQQRLVAVIKRAGDTNSVVQPTNGVFSANGKTIGIMNAGVMADANFAAVANALKQRSGVGSLKEPEVTTTSGRQSVNRITMASANPSGTISASFHPAATGVADAAATNAVPPLYSRTFQVDPRTFSADLKRTGVDSDGAAAEAELMRIFFESLGVNWESPPGKAIFFHDRTGKVFVKATESDLDTIGRGLSALNQVAPQIHIKSRFYEVPKGTLAALGNVIPVPNQPAQSNQVAGLVGILTDKNFRTVLHTLEARSDVENLAEPEVTTTSGRQTQMRATVVNTVITNMAFYDPFTNQDGLVVSNSVVPQTSQVETGPILDVVPYVLSDGYTIYLTLIPSLTEFLGYDTSTNTTAAYNRTGEKIDVPKVLPRFTTQQMVTSMNLWDNQTVIITGLPETTRVGGNVVTGKPKTNDKELLIFVTATIVDPAGNRVHSDDELPFAQTGIPSQPK